MKKITDIPMPVFPENIEPVLQAMNRGEPMIIITAPPGAGKTEVVSHAAALAWFYREPVIVVVQNFEQAQDLLERISARFPRCEPRIFCNESKSLNIRKNLKEKIITSTLELREAAAAFHVIVTTTKTLSLTDLSYGDIPEPLFRWMIIDEAWQMHDSRFAIIAPLAERFILVGDPGQMLPLVRSDVKRWKHSVSGPHQAAPKAILSRHWINPLIISLPISYRLPQDTVNVIQPVFYPNLSFTGITDFPHRSLSMPEGFEIRTVCDHAIASASLGITLVGCEFPEKPIRASVDKDIISSVVALVKRLLQSRCHIVAFAEEHEIQEIDIGIIVSREAQSHAIIDEISGPYPNVFISTVDKFQGIQRPIIIAIHPLSGKTNISQSDIDMGQICVMASRHQVVCFMFYRSGINKFIETKMPSGPRSFSESYDSLYLGWKANRQFIEEISGHRRRVRFS